MWTDEYRKIVQARMKAGICCFKEEDREHEARIRKMLGGQCEKCKKPLGVTMKCPLWEDYRI